ncbi:31077_t:CDS:2, partial [Gigaspora margarita]
IKLSYLKPQQQSPLQIDNMEDEIIDDDSESSEVQEDDDDYQEQFDDSLPPEKNNESTSLDVNNTIEELQISMYDNKLFSKNSSIEDLLIMNFSHLFNDINMINFSLQSLLSYSTNMESLDTYFKEWAVQYNQFKSTKAEIEEKMLKLLYELRGTYLTLLIMLAEDERHEQRYWVGTWRLIELLNITHCPVSILVESGLTTRFLMRDTNYDQFLKSLLNNVEANHKAPKFSNSLMLRLEL